jgi:hypothetical protein
LTVRAGSREADPLVALLTRMAVLLRVSEATFVTAAALLSVMPGHLAATIVAVLSYDAMSVVYVFVVRQSGFALPLVTADVIVVNAIALLMRWLAPADSATSAAGWIFVATSFGIILAQFAGRFRWTIPLGITAVVAFVVGAHWAGAPDRGTTSAFTLVLQLLFAAGLVAILQAAGRQAQAAAHEHHDAARDQEAARLRRDAERTALTLLHNGPLTTLTLVAQGGLSQETVTAVRAQAGVDLAVLGGKGGSGKGTDTLESVQLADLLDRTAAILRHRVEVKLTMTPCLVPAAIAQAFAGATAEALENVARHAGTGAACVELDADDERVTVTITDTGRGFDPAAVPANRFGLRESITGELERAGGRARIRSGKGTTIILEWPA